MGRYSERGPPQQRAKLAVGAQLHTSETRTRAHIPVAVVLWCSICFSQNNPFVVSPLQSNMSSEVI